jgi:nitrogen regulatory protein PII
MATKLNTEYSLIMTIVSRGYAELVIDAARKTGAPGGTVLYARGTGLHETEQFLNIAIEPEKEVVLTLVKHSQVRTVMHEILEAAGLRTKGRGISFTLPVTDIVGLADTDDYHDGSVIEHFEEDHGSWLPGARGGGDGEDDESGSMPPEMEDYSSSR